MNTSMKESARTFDEGPTDTLTFPANPNAGGQEPTASVDWRSQIPQLKQTLNLLVTKIGPSSWHTSHRNPNLDLSELNTFARACRLQALGDVLKDQKAPAVGEVYKRAAILWIHLVHLEDTSFSGPNQIMANVPDDLQRTPKRLREIVQTLLLDGKDVAEMRNEAADVVGRVKGNRALSKYLPDQYPDSRSRFDQGGRLRTLVEHLYQDIIRRARVHGLNVL